MLEKLTKKIGVFDSGLGGLSVLKHLIKDIPKYNYIYLGDNAHLPYGDKSAEQIYKYTQIGVEFLFKQGCVLVIIACNTASAQALRRLQTEWLPTHYPNNRVLGVIRPLAEYAAHRQYIKVGVIGTKATINSNTYNKEIKKLNNKTKVVEIAAPLLVPLIENNWAKKPETKMILKKYLKLLKNKQIQLLILACTHYPYLLPDIKRICGKRINVPDPGQIVSQSLIKYLDRHPELNLDKNSETRITFYTTDETILFKKLGTKFLGQKITEVNKITL